MKHSAFCLFLAFSCHTALAVVLDTLPNPTQQVTAPPGMIHIDVVFKNQPAGTFFSSLEFGGAIVPDLKPLTDYVPGATINPVKPWYDTIDPMQDAQWFSSRWGFRIDGDNSDDLPSGTSLGIRMISASPGLSTFFYNTSGSGTWQSVFLTANSPHDYVLWSGMMWHPYFTVPSHTPYGSTISATFEFFLANAINSGNVDWTTVGSNVPGYSTFQQAITWTAIPEPNAIVLLCVAVGVGLLWRRRVSSKPTV